MSRGGGSEKVKLYSHKCLRHLTSKDWNLLEELNIRIESVLDILDIDFCMST